MKKLTVVIATLLTAAAFAGTAVAYDPTADLLKKESGVADTVGKKDQELKAKKKKADDKVKEAKEAPGKAVKEKQQKLEEKKGQAEGVVKDAAAKKNEKIKKGKDSADKVKGDAGQVKDMGKKNLDDLKSLGK